MFVADDGSTSWALDGQPRPLLAPIPELSASPGPEVRLRPPGLQSGWSTVMVLRRFT